MASGGVFESGIIVVLFRDGIHGHQVNKRLESFAPCYSQSLLLADFKENPYRKIRETKKLVSGHE
jgi:hypothetical protein